MPGRYANAACFWVDDSDDPRETALDWLRIDAGMCTNCCIADAMDRDHDDCAGPEGYACDCYCEGEEHHER